MKVVAAAPTPGRSMVLGVFATTLAVYVLASVRVLTFTEPPTGDQPHYLMTTISIVEDLDLDEFDNYHAHASYDRFYTVPSNQSFKGIQPGPLVAGVHSAPRANRPSDEWYSMHGLGLPLLIAPGWLIGTALEPLFSGFTANGAGGWPGTVFEMNVFGALLAAQIFLLAWDTSRDRRVALLVWVALAFVNPLMTYSLVIFPEVPAALAVVYAFRRLSLGWAANRWWQLGLVGLGLGYLPWLHVRFLALALALLAFGLHSWHIHAAERSQSEGADFRGQRRRLVILMGPVALGYGSLVVYNYWLFGSILPTGVSEGWVHEMRSASAIFLSTAGMFLDQQFGLFVYAPICILAGVGALVLGRNHGRRSLLAWLAVMVVPYVALMADYLVWWGGWCPPARYLTVVMPLLAVPLAASLVAGGAKTSYRVAFALLGGVSWAMMLGLILGLSDRAPGQLPAILNFPGSGKASIFSWLAYHTGVDLTGQFPAFVAWFASKGQTPVVWGQSLPFLGSLAGGAAVALHATRQQWMSSRRPKPAVLRPSARKRRRG